MAERRLSSATTGDFSLHFSSVPRNVIQTCREVASLAKNQKNAQAQTSGVAQRQLGGFEDATSLRGQNGLEEVRKTRTSDFQRTIIERSDETFDDRFEITKICLEKSKNSLFTSRYKHKPSSLLSSTKVAL